ncbi:hypothetical protein [Mesorhizobium sp. B2-8-9]|uniref:head-tail joining protein n=1 Tax=Mesorhizobium sp. B2-8-9 TaxID=2589899 RepID=UPI00112A74DF|nr:hypothetical protein [Mesorhizobium sp. B2-8-9]TPI86358.1 hypothetical protein FJ423_00610 [Mesorhizobium sp. B2-8-9]
MRSHRDIKRQARRDLHDRAKVPALYIESTGADPVPVTVRIFDKFQALGDIKGTNQQYAEFDDNMPRIIFMRADLPSPKRGAIFSIEPGEAYRLDSAMATDDLTITWHVVKLDAEDADGLPVPEAG